MREIMMNYMTVERPELVEEWPAERWFQTGAVEDTPERPFAVVRFGGMFRGMGPARVARMELHFHAERGSFETIDAQILRSRDALDGAVHLTRPGSNVEIIQVRWISDSPDLLDGEHRTNVRSSQYDLILKGA